MPLRIVELRDASVAEMFGGKAFGLSQLINVGAEVPAGFAVEAAAMGDWTDLDRRTVRERSAQLLERGPVAVRSSAVGEDSLDRSFAGIFDTFLNVTDEETVLVAAGRCIDSVGSLRAQAYGVQPCSRVGVVVQSQALLRAAGVCFTIDPLGKDGAIVIEVLEGSGDRHLSPQTQPQRWRAYFSGLAIWTLVPDSGDNTSVLGRETILAIVTEAARIAGRFGYPLDLEWAVDERGKLWWVQARPITAAPMPPKFCIDRAFDGVDDGPVTAWTNWNIQETIPDPVMPLTWSVWREIILPMLVSEVMGTARSSPAFRHLTFLDLVNGRVYFNLNGFIACPFVGKALNSALFDAMEPELAKICRGLAAEGVLQPRRLPGSQVFRSLSAFRGAMVNVGRLAGALRADRSMRRWRQLEASLQSREGQRPLASLSDKQVYDEIYLLNAPEFSVVRCSWHCIILSTAIFHQALRAFRGHPKAAQLLATGIPENPTTLISLGIDQLVDYAKPLAASFSVYQPVPQLIAQLKQFPDGRLWLERLTAFLDEFGHRCPMEFDLAAPRWIERPEMIVELVRAGLTSPITERLTDRMKRLVQQRQALMAVALKDSSAWRRPILRSLARLVELYMPLREAPKHYVMFVFQRMRQAALELGERFAQRGIIATREDVFFLELSEIRAAAEDLNKSDIAFHTRIVERRTKLERFRRERAPEYLRSDRVPVAVDSAHDLSEAGVLRGTGVSSGRVSGSVKILRVPDPRAMADGDVIVMEFADPGWTPLFLRAAAVVVEVGGLMCHAAVVARELGVPAVFGIVGATRLLHDGQTVVVDGNVGTVVLKSS